MYIKIMLQKIPQRCHLFYIEKILSFYFLFKKQILFVQVKNLACKGIV
jgi:hypothetical protein